MHCDFGIKNRISNGTVIVYASGERTILRSKKIQLSVNSLFDNYL